MTSAEPVVLAQDLRYLEARSTTYQLLAAGLTYPDSELHSALKTGEFEKALLQAVKGLPPPHRLEGELWSPTGFGQEAGGTEALQREYTALFGPGEGDGGIPPYETEYGQAHVFAKAQDLADISGFYLAFGVKMSSEAHERPDHLGAELEFMHVLTFKELHARLSTREQEAEICRDAQRKFLGGHLGRWAPRLCVALRTISKSDYYRGLAELTSKFIEFECEHLGVKPEALAEASATPSKLPMLDESPERFECGIEEGWCG